MTIIRARVQAVSSLRRAACHRDSAALDAEILLARALRIPRETIYAHPERRLTPIERRRFYALIRRRARHEPIAYLLSEKEFYSLRLRVTPDVLIPRPETEGLVEAVSRLLRPPAGRQVVPTPCNDVLVIDVGTGSGAIAIALATRLPHATVIATDTSRRALAVARVNARRLGVAGRIRFVQCELLPPSIIPARNAMMTKIVIVANLPYLPTQLWRRTAPEIKKYEPRMALDGGKDGLDVYRRLLDVLPRHATLLAELLPTQRNRFASEVRRRFPRARVQRVAPTIIQVGPALN